MTYSSTLGPDRHRLSVCDDPAKMEPAERSVSGIAEDGYAEVAPARLVEAARLSSGSS